MVKPVQSRKQPLSLAFPPAVSPRQTMSPVSCLAWPVASQLACSQANTDIAKQQENQSRASASDKTEAHTANYTFLKLRVSDSSHSMTPAGDRWHAGSGAISKARAPFPLSSDTPASGCDSQKIKKEGNPRISTHSYIKIREIRHFFSLL